MPAGNGHSWETTDLGTAAYVHMRGLELLGVRRSQGRGKFVFVLSDPDGVGEQLTVDYLNSESRKFDAAVRSLKKLCYEGTPKRR